MTQPIRTYTPLFALTKRPFAGRVETLVAVTATPAEADEILSRTLMAHAYEWHWEPILWGSSPDSALIQAGAI